MENIIENNSICHEGNRNKNTDRFTGKINNDENNEQNELPSKDQM
jgi:hypothetical protein